MSASHARAVFERYLAAVNRGDAVAPDDVLHPDFQDYPGGYEGGGQGQVFGAEDPLGHDADVHAPAHRGHGQRVHRGAEGALTQAEKRRAIERHWEWRDGIVA